MTTPHVDGQKAWEAWLDAVGLAHRVDKDEQRAIFFGGYNALRAEVVALREALHFYADADVLYLGKGDWQTPLAQLTQDNGATARAALREWEGLK